MHFTPVDWKNPKRERSPIHGRVGLTEGGALIGDGVVFGEGSMSVVPWDEVAEAPFDEVGVFGEDAALVDAGAFVDEAAFEEAGVFVDEATFEDADSEASSA